MKYILLLSVFALVSFTKTNKLPNWHYNIEKKYSDSNQIVQVEMTFMGSALGADRYPNIDVTIDFVHNTNTCVRTFLYPTKESSIYQLLPSEMDTVKKMLEDADLEMLEKKFTVIPTDEPTSKMIVQTNGKQFIICDYLLQEDPMLSKLYNIVYRLK